MTVPPFHLALLAGGRGTRFWPLSREDAPKQFLRFGGARSLLQQTWDRFAPLVPPARALVLTGERYAETVREQLPEIPKENLVLEPSGRDTAPAVGLAALEARRRDPGGILVVSPADHRVEDAAAFRAAVERGVRRAEAGGLGTLGVRPDRPATSFGYLRVAGEPGASGERRVEAFVEKPDERTAARYLAAGDHFWNAGLFVFRVDVFFEALRAAAPELAAGLEALQEARSRRSGGERQKAWEALPGISIDYALMEKAGDVWTVPLEAGWDDLGGWAAAEKRLDRDAAGNAAAGTESLFLGSARTTVFAGAPGGAHAGEAGRDERAGAAETDPTPAATAGEAPLRARRLAVLVGAEDLVVVDTPDVLLVCRRDRLEEVKKAVEELRRRGREDVL